jgi:hypothetical protein
MGPGVALLQYHVVGADGEPPAGPHRVPRVSGEIDEHLVDLGRIGPHLAPRRSGQDHEGLVGAEQPLQHRHERGDRAVHVHEPRLGHLAAAEGEQLLGHLGRPRGRPDHDLDVAGLRMVLAQLLEHELAEAQHRHELVVHLVGDAAGQS